MKKESDLTKENFDALLEWLSEDREEAGRQYELIREGVTRFFHFRGCADPLLLADETINRVAQKLSNFDDSKNAKKITYFYGFASNVFLEYLRTRKNREISLESKEFPSFKNFRVENETANVKGDCLEKCLAKLSSDEAMLILQYYSKEKSEKFELRRKMAEAMNLKTATLHTKVFRLRSVLRECIEKCVKQNSL